MPQTVEDLGKLVKAKYPEYKDMPDVEVGTKVKAKYPEYSQFADMPAKPEKEGFFQSAWDQIKPIGQSILTATNAMAEGANGNLQPGRDLFKGIKDQSADQLSQAKRDITTSVPGARMAAGASALIHLGGAIPIVGAGVPAGEKAGNQIGEGNYRGAAGTLTGAIGPQVLPMVGKGVSRLAKSTGLGEGAANTLRESANKEYGQVLDATKTGNKMKSAEIAPELVKRGVMARTLKGLNAKAVSKVDGLNRALEDSYVNLPQGQMVPVTDILRRLETTGEDNFTIKTPPTTKTVTSKILGANGQPLQTQVAVPPRTIPMSRVAATGAGNVSNLSEVLTDAAEVDPKTGQLSIPVDKIVKLRRYYDSVKKAAGGYDGKNLADQSAGAAHGFAADSIREELSQQFPDIAKINKEYSFWRKVQDVTADTILRKQGQSKPLGRQIGALAGAAVGSTHGVHGGIIGRMAGEKLTAIMSSPGWRTVSAVAKDRLANAIASGNTGAVNVYISKIGGMLAAGGQTQQNQERNSPQQ